MKFADFIIWETTAMKPKDLAHFATGLAKNMVNHFFALSPM